jgi:tRNA1(Val) A37 N6-methylase TrmN6
VQGSCWQKPNRPNPTGRNPECSLDRFLDGRILAAQPKYGFRAGHDTVLLAAAVPDQPGATVLELGSGAGIASLCLAARARGSAVTGIDIDPELVQIANANAVRNDFSPRVHFICGEVADAPAESFDHVFFNPPFHRPQGTRSPRKALDIAKRDPGDALAVWTGAALKAVRPGGTVTAIVAFDRLMDLQSGAQGQSLRVFPLYPRVGAQPKRVIVRIDAGRTCGQETLRGLVLHEPGGGNTTEVEAILRSACPLVME